MARSRETRTESSRHAAQYQRHRPSSSKIRQRACRPGRRARPHRIIALNHQGDKGRTQVKRALVKQTGIKYGAVEKATTRVRATPATLTYTLKARGDETNIAWFGGVQRRKGVSAAPWNKRRIFVVRSSCRDSGEHPHVEEPPAHPAAVRAEPRA